MNKVYATALVVVDCNILKLQIRIISTESISAGVCDRESIYRNIRRTYLHAVTASAAIDRYTAFALPQ